MCHSVPHEEMVPCRYWSQILQTSSCLPLLGEFANFKWLTGMQLCPVVTSYKTQFSGIVIPFLSEYDLP